MPSPRVLLTGFMLALFLLTLLPSRWTGWVTSFSGPLNTLVTPVSWPWSELSRRLRHGPRGVEDLPAELAEKHRQVEFWRGEALAAREREKRLESTIEALQRASAAGGRASFRVLEASRVGMSVESGTIQVRRGSRDGVEVGAVATPIASPQHLLGLVSQAGPMVSQVQLINDTRSSMGLIEVALVPDGVVTDSQVSEAPRCQLRIERDGSLSGELSSESAGLVSEGPGGALAFLSDPHWPEAAQMLIVGRIAQIKSGDDPLWKRVVVRPEIDLSRVSGVVLRIPVSGGGGSGGGAAGTGGAGGSQR
ncbi:MAG TPA: rod shape-determining protein MreC [Phycisphaerales bacterium]|nr:rod shape-determining protein MreC [Phycisphaerales bacterium]